MKKLLKALCKIMKVIGIILLVVIILILTVRLIGKLYYSRTPVGGINQSMYIDVNGQAQWISIYGENKNNPVMLYLHGGPGGSTGTIDWRVLRKLAGDYTVVSWDQRGCGKTQIHATQDDPITPEVMQSDIDAAADFILQYTGKETLTVLGHSWGTMYGGDYVIRHPEKADCLIDLSLSVDSDRTALMNKAVEDYIAGAIDCQTVTEQYGCLPFLYYDFTDENACLNSREAYSRYFGAVRQIMTDWTANSPEDRVLAEQFDPDELAALMCSASAADRELARHKFGESVLPLTDRYVYSMESDDDGDIDPVTAAFFNPYYSVADYVKLLFADDPYSQPADPADERSNDVCGALLDAFDLSEKTEYAVPVYILQGSKDDYCGVISAYFDRIHAPEKEFWSVDGGHNATLFRSERLAQFVHEIAEKQKAAD